MNPVIDVLLKGAVVLTIALVATGLLRTASAAVRHRVWSLGFAALLVLPLAVLVVPDWEVGVPVPVAQPVSEGLTSPGAQLDGEKAGTLVEFGSAGSAATSTTASASNLRAGGLGGAGDALAPRPEEAESVADLGSPVGTGATLLFVAWGLGALLLLGRLLVGVVSAAWIARRARPLRDLDWAASMDRIGRDLGLDRRPRLLVSPHVQVPVTCGVVRPAVLVPESARDWSVERRDVVLTHELAHVVRRDSFHRMLADAVRAFHWVNPLVWMGGRALREEQERACDDLVLATAVTEGSDYAHHLIEIARGMGRRPRMTGAMLAMARPSQLEGRVLAVLDPTLDRRPPRPVRSLAAAALAVGLLVPLAAFTPTPAPPAAPAPQVDPQVAPTPLVRESAPTPPAGPSDEPVPRATEDPARIESEAAPSAEGQAAVPDTVEARVVEAFVRALRSDDASIRAQAAQALGRVELPQAVEPLSSVVVEDESPRVRATAAWALGMIEDAAAVPALARVLEDESTDVRRKAVWALGMIESQTAVGALADALGDPDTEVRTQAAWALGMIESDEAVDGLVSALASDESAEVRKQAAWALGMIESDAAVEALIDAIEDPDEEVGRQAMWALSMVMS